MNSNLSDNYLEQVYNNLNQELQVLMNDLKNYNPEGNQLKETDIQKQITLLNQLIGSIIKFKNLRKKINNKNY